MIRNGARFIQMSVMQLNKGYSDIHLLLVITHLLYYYIVKKN